MRTTTHWMSNRFCATWPMTRFVLSPFVATTTACASWIPASSSTRDVDSVPDDESAGPVLAEPVEGVLPLVDDGDVPPAPIQLPGNSGADPAASDDNRFHDGQIYPTTSSSRTPCG